MDRRARASSAIVLLLRAREREQALGDARLPGALGLGQALQPRRDRPGNAEGEDQAVEGGQHRDRHGRAHRRRIVHLREHQRSGR